MTSVDGGNSSCDIQTDYIEDQDDLVIAQLQTVEEIIKNEARLKFEEGRAKSEKEAYEIYCRYAHTVGFSVRKEHHTFWPNSRNIKYKDFVCSKNGFKRLNDSSGQLKFRKNDCRTGCPAMVRFKVDLDGNWIVSKFIQEHNHELAKSSDQHLLRSARVISNESASIMHSMTEAGIRAVDVFDFLATEVGGVENVGFSRRDAYNYIQRVRNSRIELGDTTSLMELFKQRQVQDNMFAFDYEVDGSNCLVNVFWVHGLGRINYDCFGDVVIFDTSYRLNKYNLVCAPIVGVNHHWQNVLFGVAFLSDETIESFEWLFRTFLRIMEGKQPSTIYTDQDQAMSRAIESTMPQARHRLCQWHISKKAPSKVPIFNKDSWIRGLFHKCLSQCDSEFQFEESWKEMIVGGKLEENNWLSDLYKIREKWSTAFNKDTFDMGILSNKRSESTNHVCHGISKPTSSLTDCFLGLEKLCFKWQRNEQDEDFKCSQSIIAPISKSSPILRQASKFYTLKMYHFFETEFLRGVGGLDIMQSSYEEIRFFLASMDASSRFGQWEVVYDKESGLLNCSCRKFETMGILCYHCNRILVQFSAPKIHERYLLPRWSANAKLNLYGNRVFKTPAPEAEPTGVIFQNHMSRFTLMSAAIAQGHEEAQRFMLSAYTEVHNKVIEIVGNTSGRRLDHEVNDPTKRRAKGISNARLKSHWEKKQKTRGM